MGIPLIMTATEVKDRRATNMPAARAALADGALIGPILAALIVDAGDLLTFGPIGIYAGFLVGAGLTFWLTSLGKMAIPFRLLCACVAGIYCTLPMTELVPIATIVSVAHRFFDWRSE